MNENEWTYGVAHVERDEVVGTSTEDSLAQALRTVRHCNEDEKEDCYVVRRPRRVEWEPLPLDACLTCGDAHPNELRHSGGTS